MEFGHRLYKLRKARGWTQFELGTRAGLHGNTISAIERGHLKPYLIQIIKLARGLEIEVEELTGEKESGQ